MFENGVSPHYPINKMVMFQTVQDLASMPTCSTSPEMCTEEEGEVKAQRRSADSAVLGMMDPSAIQK